MNWHTQSLPAIFESLATSQHRLSSKTAEEKLLLFGHNELQEEKKRTIAGILPAQVKDVMILILLAASYNRSLNFN